MTDKDHNKVRNILENEVVDQTNKPEDEDKEDEKHMVNQSHEYQTEINLLVTLILAPGLVLADS